MKNNPLAAKHDQHFNTDHLKADLKGRSVRGGVVTMVTQACKLGLQLASNVFLARLLTPQDYGLIGMVTAVIGFVSLFKDLGLSMATVQKDKVNHGQISTLFWVNVAVSLSLVFVTAALAPAIAWFYDEPRLAEITLALSGAFIFSGLTVQHQALLNRQMRFTALASIDIISMFVGIATAIIAAKYGFGYWALVFMQLAFGLTNAVGVWLMCSWRPGLPVRHSGVRSMLAFGGNLTGFSIINYFARNLDNVLIGRYWGAQQLGLYAKAYQLLLLPIQQVNTPLRAVAIPALSRLVDSPEKYRRTYLRILEKLTMLTMPGMVLMIATSDWLIELLLGSQWSDASLIFALLAFSGLVQPVSNTTGWLFITQNRTNDMFRWGLLGETTAVIFIVAGLPWGAVGVATSYAIMDIFIRTPLLYWFVGRTGPIRTIDFYRTMAPSACASLCALLTLLAFRQWIEVSNPLLGLAIASGITLGITLLILATLPGGRSSLLDLKSLLTFPSKK